MSRPTLLPIIDGIRVDALTSTGDRIEIRLTAIKPYAPCPLCKRLSGSVHGRYNRTLTDLPWGLIAVQVHVRTRRFFCDNASCQRRIFAEPLPGLADRYAHKTNRLLAAVYLIGYALGGEAGAREAAGLGLSVSPDTLLRRVRHVAAAQSRATDPVRVVGVDDWAFRKRHRYGTVLVDLERHCVLDLLPDRCAESLTQWLQDHPEVEIVSRDRAGAYAEGAAQGAPQALQVADRWHILHNLSEAMERLLIRHHRDLRQAAERLPGPEVVVPSEEGVAETRLKPTIPPTRAATSERLESDLRRQKRLDRFETVHRLHEQGQSQREIARTTGLARATIRKLLQADAFPERAQPRSLSKPLVAYLPYLTERWEQGCRNITQLHREIQEQGYRGGYLSVYRHLTGAQSPVPDRPVDVKPAVFAPPSQRSTTWLLLKDEGRRPEEEAFVQTLLSHSPTIRQAQTLALEFFEIVRKRESDRLDAWMERVESSDLPDLQSFVRGLRRDAVAVRAGVSRPWSNGQTEGQVNRLKLVKRSMYGRAKFDLLRARVMPMAQAA